MCDLIYAQEAWESLLAPSWQLAGALKTPIELEDWKKEYKYPSFSPILQKKSELLRLLQVY